MTGRAAAAPGNMPAEMTTFIGRRQLLQNVKAALGGARLVTLVGPGGVGKTRLALRSATDLSRGIADGVWLVELGSLQEPDFVTKAVMTALGLRDESSQWPVSRLIDHIATKRILIVLDNCEHLLDACAVLADAILREAPGLRVACHQPPAPGRTGRDRHPGRPALGAGRRRREGTRRIGGGRVARRACSRGWRTVRVDARERPGRRRTRPSTRWRPAGHRACVGPPSNAWTRSARRAPRRSVPSARRREPDCAPPPSDARGHDRVES